MQAFKHTQSYWLRTGQHCFWNPCLKQVNNPCVWSVCSLRYALAGLNASSLRFLCRLYSRIPLFLGHLSPSLSEFQNIWSLFPCSHNLLLHFPSLASEKDFFSYFLRPKRKLVVLAPCLWPPLLSPVSMLVWLQRKIPLWPSTDGCRLSNYIEPTEINFYDPNGVSPWVPVIVRYLGPILLSTGVPWGG